MGFSDAVGVGGDRGRCSLWLQPLVLHTQDIGEAHADPRDIGGARFGRSYHKPDGMLREEPPRWMSETPILQPLHPLGVVAHPPLPKRLLRHRQYLGRLGHCDCPLLPPCMQFLNPHLSHFLYYLRSLHGSHP